MKRGTSRPEFIVPFRNRLAKKEKSFFFGWGGGGGGRECSLVSLSRSRRNCLLLAEEE